MSRLHIQPSSTLPMYGRHCCEPVGSSARQVCWRPRLVLLVKRRSGTLPGLNISKHLSKYFTHHGTYCPCFQGRRYPKLHMLHTPPHLPSLCCPGSASSPQPQPPYYVAKEAASPRPLRPPRVNIYISCPWPIPSYCPVAVVASVHPPAPCPSGRPAFIACAAQLLPRRNTSTWCLIRVSTPTAAVSSAVELADSG